jgi:antitoxin component YwqK of YwqJK toxin-antitoxin module
MKNFTTIILVLFSFFVFSQPKYEDGPYKEYYKDGQLKKEGFYKDNAKIGGWKDYFENGQLSKVYSFNIDGTPSGIEETFSINGNLLSETKRSHNGGLISKNYFENGKPYSIYALVPSENKKYFIKSGGYKEYYENNSLKIESLYANGELQGNWIQYYETGAKEWEVAYFNGYKEGSYKQFYKNGQLKLEGQNMLDSKNGEEKRYDENGMLLWKGFYSKNDFDGLWTQYDSVGNFINTLNFNKGKLKKYTNEIDLEHTAIPDGVIEHVPVFPGCEILPGNYEKRDCLSRMITAFVHNNFNTKIAYGIGLKGDQRIYVIFKIDKTGKVIDIKARAPHPKLEKEAIDVISRLPIMKPGLQRGKEVIVPYSLPIIFNVQEKK